MYLGVVFTTILPLINRDTVETTRFCIPFFLKAAFKQLRIVIVEKESTWTFCTYKRVYLLERVNLRSLNLSLGLELVVLLLVLALLPVLAFLGTVVRFCSVVVELVESVELVGFVELVFLAVLAISAYVA